MVSIAVKHHWMSGGWGVAAPVTPASGPGRYEGRGFRWKWDQQLTPIIVKHQHATWTLKPVIVKAFRKQWLFKPKLIVKQSLIKEVACPQILSEKDEIKLLKEDYEYNKKLDKLKDG